MTPPGKWSHTASINQDRSSYQFFTLSSLFLFPQKIAIKGPLLNICHGLPQRNHDGSHVLKSSKEGGRTRLYESVLF